MTVEDGIAAALRQINHAVDLHSRRLLEEFGLTGPQLATLQAAARQGKVAAGALAKAVHLSQPTVTGILDRLERRGLIDRTRDSQDRRSTFISVTQAGHRVLDAAPSLLQDRFRKELGRLEDWEQTLILSTLQRIAALMGFDLDTSRPAGGIAEPSAETTELSNQTGSAVVTGPVLPAAGDRPVASAF